MKNSGNSLAVFCAFLSLLMAGCADSNKAIEKMADIRDCSIGVMTGSTGEQLARKKFPKATIKSFDDIMDAVAALKANQLDVVITGYPTVMNACKHNADLRYLSEPVDYENTAIAVGKENKQLLAEINQIITALKKDGTLQDMRRRWFKTDFSPYEIPVITPPAKGIVLKIGTSATREPFCFVDENRNVTGYDGELSRRISVKLSRPIQFVDMKFSALIPALQSGKVDIIAAGMTATEERKKSVDFSESYFQNSQVVLVKKGEAEIADSEPQTLQLKTIEDLANKRIGVLLGSVHDTYIMKEFPKATALQYKSPSEIILAVRSGKVDAGMYTTESLAEILRNDPALATFGKPVFSVSIGIGFNKQNGVLREQFNAFLKKIRSDGTFQDMKERWIDQGTTEMPVISNPHPSGTLVVGMVSDKGLPFTVVKDNKLIGFDIELSERFAAYIGKTVKWSDMEFGSLIAAVASNKIDMIASTLMLTEERKKQIDFSDEYMQLGASFFVQKSNIAGFENHEEFQSGNTLASFFRKTAESFHNNIVVEKRYLLIIDGLKTTAIISILAIAFGTILGGLVCYLRMSQKKYWVALAKLYIAILRGTPVLVLLMLIFYVVFASVDIDPVIVAVFAFGLNFAAYVSEMYRTGIEGVDRGQTEAGIAIGFTKIKTFIYIILPQSVRLILPVYKGEVISLVKMTSIVGYIAVQDLTKASDIIRSRTFDAFFPLIMVAVLYFIIAWVLMLLLGSVERMVDPKLKRRGLR
jgi:polar amino acid transport system substrate-binding protein